MDIKKFFKKNYIHFLAVGLFFVVGFSYFSMQYSGYSLIQGDIESHKGMAAEAVYHRDVLKESPKWTSSMFGGMPLTLISPKHSGNIGEYIIIGVRKIFELPLGSFLLHLISFYIFSVLLRIKPVIGIIGAFAFAFASYEIQILQAGHNTKSLAVAFLPAVLGAFIYTFKSNWKIGGILCALFMALEVAASHPQVTYYLGFLLLFIGIYFGVDAFKKKELKRFGFGAGAVVLGYVLAGMINYSHLAGTNDYVNDSIRGGSDISFTAKGEETQKTDGLDIEYITNWSLDRGETFTFVSPYVRGSHSGSFENSRFSELAENLELEGEEASIGPQLGMYWGQQPGVAGPFYMGVIVVFLALLALVFVRKPLTYILFGTSVLVLLLSWGKNLMGLTEFFVNNVPMYDKFRTVTIILVVMELCIAVLAVFLLQYLYDNRDALKEKKTEFFAASGVFVLLLIIVKFSGGSFTGASDDSILARQEATIRYQIKTMDAQTAAQNGIDKNNPQIVNEIVNRQLEPIRAGINGAKKMRKEMHSMSTTRSLLFTFLAIGVLALLFFSNVKSQYVLVAIGVLILADLIPVNRNYIGNDENTNGDYVHWMEKELKKYPIATTAADRQIFDMETQDNPNLLKVTKRGEDFGKRKAEELGYEGVGVDRAMDFYKFRALASATNYRVIDLSSNWNGAWNSSRTSYLHKSLGGYHPAKLRMIQSLFDFHLSNYNTKVMDMMNVKYVIRGEQVETNTAALGNGWAVKTVKKVKSADDEIKALGKGFELKNIGQGQLLVNGKPQTKTAAYAFQNIQYVLTTGDTLPLGLPNDIQVGSEQVIAINSNGDPILTVPQQLERDTLGALQGLINVGGTSSFNPKDEVIVQEAFAKGLEDSYSGEATVEMTNFNPDKIEYNVDAKGKQLIVFSEIYYGDGWTATVDGKAVDIRKVNYLLRGLEVDGGTHKVVFEFQEASNTTRSAISWIGSLVLILLLLGTIVMQVMDTRKNKELKETVE